MSKNLKPLNHYLPHKETETILLQAKIPKHIYEKIAEIREELGVSMKDMVVASFNRIIEEDGKSKK